MIRRFAITFGAPPPAVSAARLAPRPRIFVPLVLALGCLATILGPPQPGYAGVGRPGGAATLGIAVKPAKPPSNAVAQDDNDSDALEVPPAEIEKYVAVYKAMQHDRSLTVEQAATQQGFTLQAFRELESRVQRDDAALQRARDELQAAAVEATPAGRPSSAAP